MKGLASVIGGAVLLALAAPTLADIHFEYSVEGDGQAINDIMIRQGVIRLNQDEGHWSLFDTERREMTIVDDQNREYMVLDEELMEALGDMDLLMDRIMEEAMADMPPEQRDQVRGMMRGIMDGVKQQIQASIPEQTVDETDETREVAGHECRVVRILHDGELFMETCGIEPDSLDMESADREAIESMQSYIRDLVEALDGLLGTGMAASTDIALGLIPIESRIHENGEESTVAVLEAIHTEDLDEALFTVPEDYSKQDTPLPSL